MAAEQLKIQDMVAGPNELAERLDLSIEHFQKLAKEQIAVRVATGKYLVFATILNYIRVLRKAATGRDGATGQARATLLSAQARIAELKEATLRGELVRASEVAAGNSAVFREIRSRHLALAARLGAKLPHLSLSDISVIDAEIRSFLTGLADPNTYPPIEVPEA
jgi:phage terminase Nu1 subunit (DNA packaging protein)